MYKICDLGAIDESQLIVAERMVHSISLMIDKICNLDAFDGSQLIVGQWMRH